MHAVQLVEIETHQEDPGGAHLDGQIDRLETRIAGERNLPECVELHFLGFRQDPHLADIGRQLYRPGILSQPKPAESSAGFFVLLPPSPIAGVEAIPPWGEAPCVVNGEDAEPRRFPRFADSAVVDSAGVPAG